MTWELTEDVEAFATTAGEFLRSRPVQHTVLLTLVGTLRRRGLHAYGAGDPIFGRWRSPDGRTGGVLLQTPPHPMMFSSLPAEAVPAAVEALGDRPLSGANLLAGDVDVFVAGRRRRTGADAKVRMRTRLFRLDTLTPPAEPAGQARTATADDRELLLRWHAEFHDEIGEGHSDSFGPLVDERLGYGGITLWEVDGEPVAMAIRSRVESGMVRVQTVYTPRAHRARGYGGAATTVVTRQALDLGAAHVVLVTDLANPTSNALYQRLGYRPIEDRVVVEFSS
ncbi:GNAT family N-acetyltransferase [Paractinoplanes rishiriensis]|uniref:N-acetyltransferase n=1 Tax=Paractinoplanes rishiriensis TaxID=1050105 RepID=A0A919MV85_9ACTN|nr:GNAT family N-acetyltransferase [Actinoplanes rishiriensis]GIE96159.1 N-acetyltransferase [Actinoplanes rishiriensis]